MSREHDPPFSCARPNQPVAPGSVGGGATAASGAVAAASATGGGGGGVAGGAGGGSGGRCLAAKRALSSPKVRSGSLPSRAAWESLGRGGCRRGLRGGGGGAGAF